MEQTIPIMIELIQDQNVNIQFSPDFFVLYGLRGKTEVTLGKQLFELGPGGILVVNPFIHYSIIEA